MWIIYRIFQEVSEVEYEHFEEGAPSAAYKARCVIKKEQDSPRDITDLHYDGLFHGPWSPMAQPFCLRW